MSGDLIRDIKSKNIMLNKDDLLYTKHILKPFDDIVVEKFTHSESGNIMLLYLASGLILLINFPKIKEKCGMNDYILWLITLVLLLTIIFN